MRRRLVLGSSDERKAPSPGASATLVGTCLRGADVLSQDVYVAGVRGKPKGGGTLGSTCALLAPVRRDKHLPSSARWTAQTFLQGAKDQVTVMRMIEGTSEVSLCILKQRRPGDTRGLTCWCSPSGPLHTLDGRLTGDGDFGILSSKHKQSMSSSFHPLWTRSRNIQLPPNVWWQRMRRR